MLQQLLNFVARSATLSLLLLAVVFSFRIAQLAWAAPLPGSVALLVILACSICLCPGSLRDWLQFAVPPAEQRWWAGLCTAAVWWFAGLMIVHQIQHGPSVSWCLWLPILGAEIWSRYDKQTAVVSPETSSGETVVSAPANVVRFAAVRPPNPTPAAEPIAPELVDDALRPAASVTDEASLPASVTQQWTREKVGDEESMRGLIRVHFAADEMTVVVHVSFCPAFATEPEMEASVLEGTAAEVHVTHIFPYGARLEVKRTANDASSKISEGSDALIEVLAAIAG